MTATRQDSQGYDHLAPLFVELADADTPESRRAQLRAMLVAGHLPVAEHIAHRFRGRGQPEEDLQQVAAVGLINAVDRFDPWRGSDFLSFAVPTITGEVRRHFRDSAWSVRVPRRLKELHQQVGHAIADLSARLGRAPRPSEIADELGISTAEVAEGLEVGAAYSAGPLPSGNGADDGEAAAALGDRLGTEDDNLAQAENRAVLYPALSQLPERERAIVIMRFFGNLTQTQIAQRVGLSQMHVSRLLTRSMDRLRGILTELPVD
jgi:RNA polymerase sigma-B factor